MYTLAKIDDIGARSVTNPLEGQKIIKVGEDLDHMLRMAVDGFIQENPKIKSYAQWQQEGEDGGFEFVIYGWGGELFTASKAFLSQEVFNSIPLILKHHSGRKRKADDHPDMEHLLDVGRRLWDEGFVPEVVAAGYCHDLLEDTQCTEEAIEKSCGSEVLRIVKAVTNDETLSDTKDWELKKSKYIQSVREGGEKAIAVCIADKISNLHSFFAQYKKEGPSIWKKFNRGKEKKLWFEKEVLKMAEASWNYLWLQELNELIGRLAQTKE